MKLLISNSELLEDKIKYLQVTNSSQFDFGARLVAFPRVDRWDNEGKRLQSIQGGTGDLINAYTYNWQVIKHLEDGTAYIVHIEEMGFNPLSMLELYGAEYLDEQYGESFAETYGHLSSTEYVTQEIINKDENITVITV